MPTSLFHKSNALWRRAEQVLAGGPATLSKQPKRFAQGVTPAFLTEGKGVYVWDLDGHRYLDTIGALGPMILGYQHPAVDQAVCDQVRRGVSFSLAHPLEVEVAELLVRHVPGADKVRFCKNGADATEAAIRLARAVTGQSHVICCGYHGKHDSYLSTTANDGGILPFNRVYNHQCAWGDWGQLKTLLECHGDKLAAFIVEVPPTPWGEPEERMSDTLAWLHDTIAEHNAVFILDEVVTGFRYGLSGAQGRYGIIPDLTCLGKALANGYPLAAVTGREDLMDLFEDGHVFLSTTYGGDAVSLAAAKATITILRDTDALATLKTIGTTIGDGLQALFMEYGIPVQLTGNEARMVLQWQEAPGATAAELRTLWLQENVTRGILHGGPLFPQCCMTERDVRLLLDAAREACQVIRQALDAGNVAARLIGPPVREVFWKRYPAPEDL